MRPAITGDAKALLHATHMARDASTVESRVGWLVHGLLIAIDLPEPEPTAKAEEEPDYTCQKCGVEDGCIHLTSERLSIANRRIAQLTRERDHFREVADLSKAAREVARSRAIQDTKDAAELMSLEFEWPAAAYRIRNLEVK